MRKVVIESPYAGDRTRNAAYLQECIADSLARGEAPFASHLMYTGVLNDDEPGARALGIKCGEAWRRAADATVVYMDHGISRGMLMGVLRARALHPVEYRSLHKK